MLTAMPTPFHCPVRPGGGDGLQQVSAGPPLGPDEEDEIYVAQLLYHILGAALVRAERIIDAERDPATGPPRSIIEPR
eukprot:5951351-Pyramimonas_sp.AAC.1